jgi:hypothetical protein
MRLRICAAAHAARTTEPRKRRMRIRIGMIYWCVVVEKIAEIEAFDVDEIDVDKC